MLGYTKMSGRIETAEDVKNFVLAGNATFTIVSTKTSTRYTYKVRRSKEEEGKPVVYFVSLLNGPDNQNDYCYMGIITATGFRFTAKSTVRPEAPSAKAFVWFFDAVLAGARMPATLEVWHEGKCGRCGRALTVPESIARGIGPECADKMGM
jgi:hypothetical protein